jgi:hypothetical protein
MPIPETHGSWMFEPTLRFPSRVCAERLQQPRERCSLCFLSSSPHIIPDSTRMHNSRILNTYVPSDERVRLRLHSYLTPVWRRRCAASVHVYHHYASPHASSQGGEISFYVFQFIERSELDVISGQRNQIRKARQMQVVELERPGPGIRRALEQYAFMALAMIKDPGW